MKNWSLSELTALFPFLTDRRVGFRCTNEVPGRGRYIKSVRGREQFADVALRAKPHPSFAVRFAHTWPDAVSPEEVKELDHSLLRGVVERLHLSPPHVGECVIVTEAVRYRPGDTTPLAVTIAASMAITDILKRAGWIGGEPGPSVGAA
jgi:hypothetical protein